jgi:hypothetical protein
VDTSDPRDTKSLVCKETEASENLLCLSSSTWWILCEVEIDLLSFCVFVASGYPSITKSGVSSPEPPELRLDAPEVGREFGRGSGCEIGVGSDVVAATLLDKGDSAKYHGFFLGLDVAELGLDFDLGLLGFDLGPFLQKGRMAKRL